MSRYLYLAPAAALLVGILGFPLALSVFSGGGHYAELSGDPLLRRVTVTTAAFAVVSVALEMAFGLAFALILHHAWRMRGSLRAIALLPWALPSAVMAMAWRWIFNDNYGVASHLLMDLGLIDEPIAWLGRPLTAFATIVVADVWKSTAFVTIILLAGLQSIPRELHEAMSIDGAGPLRRFWMLTLPLLRPALGLALTFRLIQAVGVFDLVWVLTGGGPADATRPVALYVYDQVFRYLRPEYGAAITAVVAAVLMLLGLAAARLTRAAEA